MGDNIPVECYSGHTYAEQPRAFVLESERRMVKTVHKRWREPAGPRFQVLADDGATYVLAYDEATDRWRLSCHGLKRSSDAPEHTATLEMGEDGQR
jgi:hypothetical protein